MSPLRLAYSPCPNDTFMFHALAAGELPLPGGAPQVELHDVEALNRLAQTGRFDVTKLSFHGYLQVRDRYALLPVGVTLGYGCGPLVVSRRAWTRAELPHCRVALPGEHTTAHLLFNLWAPAGAAKRFVRYDEIFGLVASGAVECGVVIHEGRFTYAQAGLRLLADLGAWWEAEAGLPVPLGGIAIRRDLGAETATAVTAALRDSIGRALADPARTMPYVRQHAQELDEAVLRQHITTFVNPYCLELDDTARAALARATTAWERGTLA